MDGSNDAKKPDFLLPGNRYMLLEPAKYQEDGQDRLLTELQLRRLTGVEKLIMEGPDLPQEKLFRMTETITGHPRILLNKIDWVDWERIDEIYGYFTKPGSVTGVIS